MNKFKKLVPAICMLLVSAVLMGTSTFAWFSMNTSVKANNLGVTAKSNAQFLYINTAANAGQGKTEADSAVATDPLYPATFIADAKASTTIGDKTIPTESVGQNKWFTANSTSASTSNTTVTNIKEIKETDAGTFAKYVKTYTYYLTLAENSEDYKGKLSVTMTDKSVQNADDVIDAVKAVVKVTPAGEAATPVYLRLDAVDTAATIAQIEIKATTTVKVEVFVYIDGTDNSVTSQNLAEGKKLAGKFNVKFDIEVK